MKLKTTLLICLTALFTYQSQAQCSGAQFQEVNGIAVIEAENGSRPSAWARETSVSGATAGAYMAYRGSNSFSTPSSNVAKYTVRINSPGTYRFIWRNRIGIIASSGATTEHNDSWLRIQGASNFYGQRGSSRIFPRGSGKSPNPEGASANGYFKIYTNTLGWNWATNTSDNDPHVIYVTFSTAGVKTIEVSGRSKGHFIDRIVLFKENQYSLSSAQSTNRSQTTCDGSSNPPPPPPPPPPTGSNNAPTVSITSPTNGQSFTAGSNITVKLNANDSDGNIVKHQIFVNNVLKDTDGTSYSAYQLTNVTAGSYAIKATVTDNGGKTASNTVNITVGSGSPPPPPPSGNNAPTVSITSPTSGQNIAAGSNVSVKVSASDSDGSVVKYQIFVNGSLKDTDGSSYTPHVISNIAAGSYAIKATVTDNGGKTASTTVNITVGSGNPPPPPPPSGNNAPTVSITSPNNGQNFAAGSNVSIKLSANDTDGNVVKYQIFVNNKLVDTDGTLFTPHVISNIAAGSYAIKGTVTDNDGATASATVNITVGSGNPPPPPPPPPSGSGGVTFTLINALTNADLGPMPNGNNIRFASNKNIRANSSFSGTKSIYFNLTGPLNQIWTENDAPYALFGDVNGDYVAQNFPTGTYKLTAEAWSGSNRSGTKLGSKTINFTAGSSFTSKSIQQVYVYPNPIENGRFSVKVPEEVVGDVFYSLISTSGAAVETGKISVERAGDNAEFNLDSFDNKNNGVYYLILQSKGSSYTVPLIKK